MDDKGVAVILEDINDKLTAILEGQSSMVGVPVKLEKMDNRLNHMETYIKATKSAVIDPSKESRYNKSKLKDHEARISVLE